ncbi:MAG TPA: SusC/RagA family TonB-linked outer membrane protein [Chitinophagaceae bacterium]|nr:SusC/RagA family TonB-linked outer membrane protein [Chitinophagaceae bacterium]
MTQKRLLPALLVTLLLALQTFAQQRTISGRVTDNTGAPVPGVTVTVKGTNLATQTSNDGTYRLNVPENANTLVFSAVGYGNIEGAITGSTVDMALQATQANLNEVVVVGYGTARKRDLTGSVASVKAKDFNTGVFASPDNLIQGKVAGVQVLNNSGAPGGASTIRIRGISSIRSGNSPLIVVDGVPLSGGSSQPGLGTALGSAPGDNPLNFINPNDIASMDVLKDASATAIFGSRGANGVIVITTKKGTSGAPKIEFNTQLGVSNMLRQIDVLDAAGYRAALKEYNQTSGDYGGSVNAMDEILRTAYTQNYNFAVSGGNENGRYRLSAGYLNQEGIVKESGFKKLSTSLTSSFKFTESKKLGLDFNLLYANTTTDAAPISNDAGFQGSLIGTALQWNPTHPLRKPNDSIWVNNQLGATTVNPLALLAAYDDRTVLNNIIASISPSYKLMRNMEIRMLYAMNYSQAERRTEIRNWLNLTGNFGSAQIQNNRQVNQTLNYTLSYTPQLTKNISLNTVIGYEYLKYDYKGSGMSSNRFFDYPGLRYTDYMQNSPANDRGQYSFAPPINELQSYFARATFSFGDRFLLTGTFRADGSSKFGANNKYGYFPSVAGAWNVMNENFLRSSKAISTLKLRASWGQTGNQEFPTGVAVRRVNIGTLDNTSVANFENPDVKWETNTMWNVGVDFGLMNNRLTGTVDYFSRKTTDPLFSATPIAPAPASGVIWQNLDASIVNSGFELSLNWAVIRNEKMTWNIGGNIAFLKNEVQDLKGSYQTGGLHGQGISGATSQLIVAGQPLNVFYLRKFEGIDKGTGQSIYAENEKLFYSGSPNPKQLFGITTDFNWNKLFAVANFNGASGHYLYNNTANSVINVGNLGTRNIDARIPGTGENLSNAIAPSTRYLEKGDYLKLANMTVGYRIGNLGKPFKNVTVTLTGQNLFVITNFHGFDPEVNVDKNVNGIPSSGIEYIPYPSARTILLGLQFGL